MAKTVLEDFAEFHAKWYSTIHDEKLRAGIEQLHSAVVPNLERLIDKLYVSHLQKVIEARKDMWIGEELFQADLAYIALVKEAPPALLPGLLRIYSESEGKEFEPIAAYQQAEEDTAESERDYRKALIKFQGDWPERIDSALLKRLETLDGEGANLWHAELEAQQSKRRGGR